MRTRAVYRYRYYCTRLLLLLLTVVYTISASSDSSSRFELIPHLESSLAASAAQGTTVAISSCLEQADCCALLLTRTPRPQQEAKTMMDCNKETDATTSNNMGGLTVLAPNQMDYNSHHQQFTSLRDSAVCCMTGFLPDVQHVRRVVLKRVENHSALYDSEMSNSKLVRLVANHLDRATRTKGGRPWGVQVLLVSCQGNDVKLYTVQPTGGWRVHDSFAVVGRHAPEIQQSLMMRDDGVEERKSPPQALEQAMRAMLEQVRVDHADDVAKYEALLVWFLKGKCQTAMIHPDAIEDCHAKMLRELKKKQSKDDRAEAS